MATLKNKKLIFLGTHDILRGVFDSHNLGFLELFFKEYSDHIKSIVMTAFIKKNLNNKEKLIIDKKIKRLEDLAKNYRIKSEFIPFEREDFSSINKNINKIKNHFNKEDKIILIAQNYFNGYIGYKLKRNFKNIQFHLDLKGVAPEEELNYSDSKITARLSKYLVLKYFERLIIKNYDSISLVSKEFRKYLLNKYNIKKKIIIYPSVFNSKRFYYNNRLRIKYRRFLGLKKDDKLIIYSGSFQKWQLPNKIFKNFKTLLKNKGFYGLIMTYDIKTAKEFVKRYNLKKIKVLTARGEDLNGYYNAGDVGLIFRKKDLVNKVSCPTKIAEYLITKNSVILNDGIGDFSRYLKNKKFAIVKKEYEEFSKIDIKERNKLEKPKINDLKYIKKEFSDINNIKKYKFLFEK